MMMRSTLSPKCLLRWGPQLTLRNADWGLRRSAQTNQLTVSHHRLQIAYNLGCFDLQPHSSPLELL